MVPKLMLTSLVKYFDAHPAVAGLDLTVSDGEIVALLGPSGCGKTTTLRLIAGFERVDSGAITIRDRLVEDPRHHVPADKRRVGVVFQDYALFPHLDVAANIAFGLAGRARRRRRSPRVDEMLHLVGLTGLEKRYPHELSGGQQQRVALARALAPQPDVLLLDEPFSNLDPTLRQKVRAEVEAILRETGVTTIFVTHAQDEALSIADRVAVMDAGRVVQIGTPEELYRNPSNPFVAEFVADATLVQAIWTESGLDTPFGKISPHILPTPADALPFVTGNEVTLAIKPEAVRIAADASAAFEIIDREYYGHDEVVTIAPIASKEPAPAGAPSSTDINIPTLRARLDAQHLLRPGARVKLDFHLSTADVFSSRHPEGAARRP